MLTTIKGVYDEGNLALEELPKINTKTDVIVTFYTPEEPNPFRDRRKIVFGNVGRQNKDCGCF